MSIFTNKNNTLEKFAICLVMMLNFATIAACSLNSKPILMTKDTNAAPASINKMYHIEEGSTVNKKQNLMYTIDVIVYSDNGNSKEVIVFKPINR